MKKIWIVFKNFIISAAAKEGIEAVGDVVEKSLEDFYAKNSMAAMGLVKSLYAFVPFLQNLTATTATPLDDNAVAEIKAELEEFAARHGFTL